MMSLMDAGATPGRGSRRCPGRILGIAALASAALLVAAVVLIVLAVRAAHVREAVRVIEAAGGYAAWDYEIGVLFDGAAPVHERASAAKAFSNRYHAPDLDADGRSWLRRLLGPEWLHDVALLDLVKSYTPSLEPLEGASLPGGITTHIQAFPRLRELVLFQAQATDATLEAAGKLRSLEYLRLFDAELTDVGLAALAGLVNLRGLWVEVGAGRVTDDGVRHLMKLARLEVLELQNVQVTGRTIEVLLGLRGLRVLTVNRTSITQKGIEMLRAELPGLRAGR
jgi:hypothetical protein